jgi:hypothetical protein
MTLQKPASGIRPKWLWLTAILLGWLFDALFWGRQVGVSFPIYTILCLLAGLGVARMNKQAPHHKALLLIAPVLFFSVMVFIRSEPLTVFLDILLTLTFLVIFADTVFTGRWLQYGFLDYGAAFIRLFLAAFLRPLTHPWRTANPGQPGAANRGLWKFLPYLRGILLAIPFFLFFACLLAAADPVFSSRLQQIFNIEKIPEYLFRCALIAFLAYLFAGVFLHALDRRAVETPLYSERQVVSAFLGSVESTIIYLVVNLLFLSFVVVQFQYFFGGQANVHIDGYTYSEYARRGFWELIAVAFFSLLMFLGLHGTTKRSGPVERWLFTGLAAMQMVLVQVILYSAFVRLNLYEAAYGFSRLRTYAHVFLVWIGILFLVVIILDICQRTRWTALVFVSAAAGFVVSLNLLNVDAFIVRQNIRLATGEGGLDAAYLESLSDDAIPTLKESFFAETSPVQKRIGASLTCYAAHSSDRQYDSSWQALHWGRFKAKEDLQALSDVIQDYVVTQNAQGSSIVRYQGTEYPCEELSRVME